MTMQIGSRVDLLSDYEDAPQNGKVVSIDGNSVGVDWTGNGIEFVEIKDLVESEKEVAHNG